MNQDNKASKRSKQELNSLIRRLVLRREKHEAIIDKLVSPFYLSRDVTKESLRQN